MPHLTKAGATEPGERIEIDDERRAMWDEHKRNFDYFIEHGMSLFEEHPDEWLLIHSGSEVEHFDHLGDLFDRLDTFGKVQRGAAIIERRKTGPRITSVWRTRASTDEQGL